MIRAVIQDIPILLAPTHERLVARIETLLGINYRALGFALDRLWVGHVEDDFLCDGMSSISLRWRIRCPCGGVETAAANLWCHDASTGTPANEEAQARAFADQAMAFTASREHLAEDVARGTLPASALDGAVYTGPLLIEEPQPMFTRTREWDRSGPFCGVDFEPDADGLSIRMPA